MKRETFKFAFLFFILLMLGNSNLSYSIDASEYEPTVEREFDSMAKWENWYSKTQRPKSPHPCTGKTITDVSELDNTYIPTALGQNVDSYKWSDEENNKARLEKKEAKVLELGAGSGLISALMAREGFLVTASDINPVAVRSILETKEVNQLKMKVIESDLLNQIPLTTFQYILINPPYFPQVPTNDREKAFFCGADFEYFHRLFDTIGEYMTVQSSIYMILSDDCAIETMQEISYKNRFQWKLVHEEKVWGETNFIYKIIQK